METAGKFREAGQVRRVSNPLGWDGDGNVTFLDSVYLSVSNPLGWDGDQTIHHGQRIL